jgi:hypothetical protein
LEFALSRFLEQGVSKCSKRPVSLTLACLRVRLVPGGMFAVLVRSDSLTTVQAQGWSTASTFVTESVFCHWHPIDWYASLSAACARSVMD